MRLSDFRSISCSSYVSSVDSESVSSEYVESYIKERSKRRCNNSIQTIEFGTLGTLQYRMLFLDDLGREISPLDDISLFLDNNQLNLLCQTPKGTWIEYEAAPNEYSNPLRIKNLNGKPSHYAGNVPWNYGILPQTSFKLSDLNEAKSDANSSNKSLSQRKNFVAPLEVVEISGSASRTGEVYPVKVLGSFAVIDIHANLTWKVIAIAVDDPMVDKLNSVNDVESEMPGLISRIREWLRNYHCVDLGRKRKLYGLSEKPASNDITTAVINEAHTTWKSVNRVGRNEDFSIPFKAPISVYQAFWKTYTDKYDTEKIPLSESSFSSFRYEKAWVELYSPHATERSSTSSVQCNCYTMLPISCKTVTLGKPNRSRSQKTKPRMNVAL